MREVLTGIAAGLQRRLETDTLTQEDRERIELVRRVKEMRADGKTFDEIGPLVDYNPKSLAKFVRGGVYKLLSDHLESLDNVTDEKAVERVVRRAKQDFAGLTPSAIAFLKTCFKRTPDGKEFLDPGLAQWATNLVAKGTGLTEPSHVVRPVIQINLGVIKAELKDVSGDDERARSAVIEITPSPAGSLPAPQQSR